MVFDDFVEWMKSKEPNDKQICPVSTYKSGQIKKKGKIQFWRPCVVGEMKAGDNFLFGEDEDPYRWTDGGERDVLWRPDGSAEALEPPPCEMQQKQQTSQRGTPADAETISCSPTFGPLPPSSSSFPGGATCPSSSSSSSSFSSSSSSSTSVLAFLPMVGVPRYAAFPRATALKRLVGLGEREGGHLSRITSSLLSHFHTHAARARPEAKQQQLLLALEKAEKAMAELRNADGRSRRRSGSKRRRTDTVPAVAHQVGEQQASAHPLDSMEDIWEVLSQDEFETLMQQAEQMCASVPTTAVDTNEPPPAKHPRSAGMQQPLVATSSSPSVVLPLAENRAVGKKALRLEEEEQKEKEERQGTQQLPILIDGEDEAEEEDVGRRRMMDHKRKWERDSYCHSQSACNLTLGSKFPSSQTGKLSLKKPTAIDARHQQMHRHSKGGTSPGTAWHAKQTKGPETTRQLEGKEEEAKLRSIKVETVTKITLVDGQEDEQLEMVEESKKLVMPGLREVDRETMQEDLDRIWGKEQPIMRDGKGDNQKPGSESNKRIETTLPIKQQLPVETDVLTLFPPPPPPPPPSSSSCGADTPAMPGDRRLPNHLRRRRIHSRDVRPRHAASEGSTCITPPLLSWASRLA